MERLVRKEGRRNIAKWTKILIVTVITTVFTLLLCMTLCLCVRFRTAFLCVCVGDGRAMDSTDNCDDDVRPLSRYVRTHTHTQSQCFCDLCRVCEVNLSVFIQ